MSSTRPVRSSSTGTFVGASDVEFVYDRWGTAQTARALLIIVHGLGEHSGRYRNLVQHLVPLGYALYTFDLRGHGRSSGPRGHILSWDEYRADLGAFVMAARAEEPDSPLFLMGHSLGGLIALDYALRRPAGLRGVIASAPTLAQTGVSPALMMLGRVVSRIHPGFSLDVHLDATAISRDAAVVESYRADPLVHSRGSARLSTEVSAVMAWTNANALNWRLSLLILHGEADRIVPIDASRQFFDRVPIADKTFRSYPGGYHEPHNDTSRQEALRDVAQWLDTHTQDGERNGNNTVT